MTSYGMSGEVFHAPLLSSHAGFHLKKVLERSKQKSRQRYPSVEIVQQFDAILSDQSIELVIINTPNSLHFEMGREALLAGKHVVMEKPFTVTTQEAQTLIHLAKEQGRVLSVFQNRRWDGDFMTVQKVIAEGLLGQLVEYEAHYDRFRNYIEVNTWKEETGPGSGILYNLGSHMIDQALVLFGFPQSITADIRTQRPGGKIEDAYELILEYGAFKVTLKSSYLVREPGPRYVLHGTNGSFVKYGLDPQEEALKAGRMPREAGWGVDQVGQWGILNTEVNGLHVKGTVETLPGNYTHFYDNIYQVICEGAELLVKPKTAVQCIRLIETAMQSSREKRTIALG